jgi:hypothetical protein
MQRIPNLRGTRGAAFMWHSLAPRSDASADFVALREDGH